LKVVGVYSAEAGVESKISDSVHLWCLLGQRFSNFFYVTAH